MAIRKRAGRSGRWGTGARIGFGLSEGLAGFGDAMTKRATAEQTSEGALGRTLLKDYADKVIAGTIEPEQAEAALTTQGVKVPSGYFHTLAPSVSTRLSSMVGDITKAGSPQEVPTEAALQMQTAPLRLKPSLRGRMSPPTADPASGQTTLPSRQFTDPSQMESFSPDFEQLLNVRNKKMDLFEDVARPGVDAAGNKQIQYIRPWERAGTLPQEPMPQQAGTRAATQEQTRIDLEGAMGLPGKRGAAKLDETLAAREPATSAGQYKGEEKVAELGVSGGALANQAARESAARKQAELAAEASRLGLTQKQQTAYLSLGGEFSSESRPFYTVQTQYRILQENAKSNTPAGSIALTFAFMKMNDPTSSVMQGEAARVENAGGTPEWMRNLYNKVLKTGVLSPENRRQFLATGATIYNSSVAEHQERVQNFTRRAQQLDIPPTFIREAAPDLRSPLDRARGQ